MKRAESFPSNGDFGFDINDFPVKNNIDINVASEEFADMEFITEGSNSHIFTARWRGQTVIVKMLQVEKAKNTLALQEFAVEIDLLKRLNHGNVIHVLGAGRRPRPYIILERLRDLNVMLGLNNPDAGGSGGLLGKRGTFTFAEVLRISKDLADALDYCHDGAHRDAMILHRDLKPENLGLTTEGRLKLFDFGLCRCVKKRTSIHEVYEMTGNTGSLRYMAPEVALNRPYNEKVDVFSFAMVVWTIAREKVPYKGYDRQMHKDRVVLGGERPKIDSGWPQNFCDLLETCWQTDSERRPTMAEVSEKINRMLSNGDIDLSQRSGSKSLLRKISSTFSIRK